MFNLTTAGGQKIIGNLDRCGKNPPVATKKKSSQKSGVY